MEIYVEMSGFDSTQSKYSEIIRELDSVQISFRSVTSTLDWNVKSKANIQKHINILSNELSSLHTTVNSYSNFINASKENYTSAENYNEQETNKLKNDLFGGKYKTGGSSVIPGINSGKDEGSDNNVDLGKFLGSLFDGIASLMSKYGNETISSIGSLLSFGKGVFDLFGKYKNGANCKSLLVMNLVKFGKTAASAAAGIKKNILKGIDNFYLKHGMKEQYAANIKKLNKISDGLKISGIVIDSAITGFESYHKYSADGDFSQRDLGSTLIDVGSTGLISAVTTGLTFAFPPVGIGLSVANSIFDFDGKLSNMIKAGCDEGLKGVGSALVDAGKDIADTANGIKNVVGEKIKSVGDFVSGCTSKLYSLPGFLQKSYPVGGGSW